MAPKTHASNAPRASELCVKTRRRRHAPAASRGLRAPATQKRQVAHSRRHTNACCCRALKLCVLSQVLRPRPRFGEFHSELLRLLLFGGGDDSCSVREGVQALSSLVAAPEACLIGRFRPRELNVFFSRRDTRRYREVPPPDGRAAGPRACHGLAATWSSRSCRRSVLRGRNAI